MLLVVSLGFVRIGIHLQVYKCIPALAKLLYSDDPETLSHCCWSVSFFADGPNDKIQKIIDGGITRRLVELLMHPDRKVVPPALRAVGNMLTGDDVQTQVCHAMAIKCIFVIL